MLQNLIKFLMKSTLHDRQYDKSFNMTPLISLGCINRFVLRVVFENVRIKVPICYIIISLRPSQFSEQNSS